MEIHELCRLFPEMSKEEFDELCEDIKKHGIIERVITYQGKVLDGRNRYKASQLLDCDVYFEEWEGQCGTPLAYVVSRNLHRRSLAPGQRAAIALDVKDRLSEQYEANRLANLKRRWDNDPIGVNNVVNSEGNAQKESARMLDVSQGYVSDAQRIREHSPETFEEVKLGKKSIPQAKRELGLGGPRKKLESTKEPAPERPTSNAKPAPTMAFIAKVSAELCSVRQECLMYDETIMEDVVSHISGAIKAMKLIAV